MFTHIAVVRDLVDTQYKEYQEVSIQNGGARCLASLDVMFAGRLKCPMLRPLQPHPHLPPPPLIKPLALFP